MSNILRRPMFRLGGQSSDGVGITSGLNRKNYGYGDKYLGQLDEMYDASNKALDYYGKVGTPELMLTLSDVIRQGGSISDMVGNATSAVLPMAANYTKAQSLIPSMKFKNLATMAELGIKSDVAGIETATQTRLRAGQKANEIANLYGGISSLMAKAKTNDKKAIQDLATYNLNERISNEKYMDERTVRANALKFVQDVYGDDQDILMATLQDETSDAFKLLKQAEEYIRGLESNFAQGGRVGLRLSYPGTVEEASMAEQIQTPGGVEDITENEEVIAEGQEMGGPKNDPFVILRARLPKEITDDVVKLIAYNPDAFKDFAAIETQQDVINFNETYGVELVLPTEQV